MLLNKHKSNRLPFIALCLITLGFYGLWAYGLRAIHVAPEDWSVWRAALIAGGIYLGLIYVSAIDFSVINTLCMMVALWGVMAILFVACAFVVWGFPHPGPLLVNDILLTHVGISIVSAVWGRLFQFVRY